MTANSNMGFRQGTAPATVFNRHAISFQSGAINSSAGMIPPLNSIGVSNSNRFPDSFSNSGGFSGVNGGVGTNMATNSGGGLDPATGLKHDTGLAVEWSLEEQSIMDEGLVKYADESNIMRYIKIAAALREKTVRDVALRCRWMTKKENGKRRKPEDHYTGKKLKDWREKVMDASRTNIPPNPQLNMAAYPFMMHHHMDPNNFIPCEAPVIGSSIRHLLEENAQVFSQIRANLDTFKIQENIDLFCRTRSNIITILNEMRDMPGIMSQMPPLQVAINEELASTILPSTSQTIMFAGPGIQHLKQELG